MNSETVQSLSLLVRGSRQAVLAVCQNNVPTTAMVSYATENPLRILIQLSNLSAHKKLLLANPTCSVLVAQPDDGRADVMTLARVSLNGDALLLNKNTADYDAAQATFLAALPASDVLFALPDFDLFRITPTSGRYIAGFGRAFALTADELSRL